MRTTNERIQDAVISHQVDLQHFSNGIVHKIIALLNRTDSDLFGQLNLALERLDPASFTVERLELLLQSVRILNAQAYLQVDRSLTASLRDTLEQETEFQLELFRAAIPPQVLARVSLVPVSIEQTMSAVLARPFQGKLLAEWSKSMEDQRMARIRDSIRMGFVENQTISQMVQRVRGTRAKGYSDGLIEIDRRNAESVVRTAVSHTAAHARNTFIERNDDIIAAVQWCSTLDTRTSEICRIRDGLKYTPVEHKPIGHKIPWLGGAGAAHWCCRSTAVPVTRSWKDLGIDLPELDAGSRAAMDGQTGADVSYGDWLQRQSAARQDQILGVQRGKLMRQGGLTLDKFYNDRGKVLDLDAIRERNAEAFKRAGL